MKRDGGGRPACPLPFVDDELIQLAHGGGGRRMHRLIEGLFLHAFSNPQLDARHDGAVFEVAGQRLAFTTDSYVVDPIFFPGGDIGSLAVNGTVNDLAMCGARPLHLSAGLIIEEGLLTADLERVVASMRDAAAQAGATIVTGDTKVVDKGKGDRIFINTAGIGVCEGQRAVGPAEVRPGDAIIVSGDIGRHAVAVLAARDDLGLESEIASDCAPLAGPALDLLRQDVEVHCLRDLTRGGLASALVEIAETSKLNIVLDEASIPVRDDVRGACELLGFDPLYLANEGRFVAFVPETAAETAQSILREHAVTRDCTVVGRVGEGGSRVEMTSLIGGRRRIDMLSGEQLPRIC